MLGLERVDPIDTPGTYAHHTHYLHGGNQLSIGSTNDDLRNSTCTSCSVKQDHSAYWTPNLYWESPDKLLYGLNQTGGMLVYYIQRGENLVNFPPGLRIIAGNPDLRSFDWPEVDKSQWIAKGLSENQPFLRQMAVGFNCLNYAEPANAALGLRGFPTNWENCVDGLRAEVFFPSCWDGKNSDSSDHRSHMAYPSFSDDGDCPVSHPMRTVSIFYETIINIAAVKVLRENLKSQGLVKGDGPGRLVLSHGDPTGYGYHADFMNGWKSDVFQRFIDECRDPSGVMEKCTHLEFNTEDEQRQCTKAPEVPEDVYGGFSKLPGCNPVSTTPGARKQCPKPQGITPSTVVPVKPEATYVPETPKQPKQSEVPQQRTPPTCSGADCYPTADSYNATIPISPYEVHVPVVVPDDKAPLSPKYDVHVPVKDEANPDCDNKSTTESAKPDPNDPNLLVVTVTETKVVHEEEHASPKVRRNLLRRHLHHRRH